MRMYEIIPRRAIVSCVTVDFLYQLESRWTYLHKKKNWSEFVCGIGIGSLTLLILFSSPHLLILYRHSMYIDSKKRWMKESFSYLVLELICIPRNKIQHMLIPNMMHALTQQSKFIFCRRKGIHRLSELMAETMASNGWMLLSSLLQCCSWQISELFLLNVIRLKNKEIFYYLCGFMSGISIKRK